MPLPMVHLWVAVRLAEREKRSPSPEFLLGSIAPDAVHMRTGFEQVHKRESHLDHPPDTPDHARVKEFVARYGHGDRTREELAQFAFGYAAHILTDRLWALRAWRPYAARNAHMIQEELKARYYRETDQVDFILYDRAEWRGSVWQALARAKALDVELVAPSEVDQWRQRTLHWFDDRTKEPGIVPQEFTYEFVAGFVEEATLEVAACLDGWGVRLFR